MSAAFLLACLDSPRFQLTESDTAKSASTDSTMVRVPAAVLGEPGVATQGEGKGNGKGKDAGAPPGADAGTPPNDPPPAPPGPAGTVVSAFWIDAREVTSAQYDACVTAGSCTAATCTSAADHPVACVSLEQAADYCASLSKRLLTEDEFTSAAAGSAARLYPWGNEAPSTDRLAMSTADTSPVGSFAKGATPDGVFDLAGNVAELVATGRARGGSFADTEASAVESKAGITPAEPTKTVGFRCARD